VSDSERVSEAARKGVTEGVREWGGREGGRAEVREQESV